MTSSTENSPLYFRHGRLVSMGRKVIKVGGTDLREINLRLRGVLPPQRCTCATDHGWHV